MISPAAIPSIGAFLMVRNVSWDPSGSSYGQWVDFAAGEIDSLGGFSRSNSGETIDFANQI